MTSPDPQRQPPFVAPPPPPGYGPPYRYQPAYPVPPKKKGMPTWAVILLVVGGIIAALCVGGIALVGIGAKGISDSNTAASKDVTLSSCTDGGEFVGPQATVSITNHGTTAASYFVTVEFVSSDGSTQYGTGTAIVNGLAPGQNASADATSFAAGKAGSGFKCRVTKVTKT